MLRMVLRMVTQRNRALNLYLGNPRDSSEGVYIELPSDDIEPGHSFSVHYELLSSVELAHKPYVEP